jgi:hypothetical protein
MMKQLLALAMLFPYSLFLQGSGFSRPKLTLNPLPSPILCAHSALYTDPVEFNWTIIDWKEASQEEAEIISAPFSAHGAEWCSSPPSVFPRLLYNVFFIFLLARKI